MPYLNPGPKSHGDPRHPNFEIKDKNYNMNHKHRGLAFIFNHEFYELHSGMSQRKGTAKDRDKLAEVLQSFGFRVEVKNDLTFCEINNYVRAAAKMNHTRNDCLLIAVLTHGGNGLLFARDTFYKYKQLWSHFTDKLCPTLAGKPKIFIIQACRGNQCDAGTSVKYSNLYTDGMSALYELPSQPDFLFAFSTPPEHFAWRNRATGSCFIQTLCNILMQYAKTDTSLLTLLTFVCRKVAVEYESYVEGDPSMSKKKQTTNIYSTLTRLLILQTNCNKIDMERNVNCCVAI